MHRLLILILLFSAKAMAVDFRTLDFGQSCADVSALEKEKGSKGIPWSGEPKELIAFKGNFFGTDATILYFCPGGVLFTGNYFFPHGSLEEAVRAFHKIYDQVNSTYGEPAGDPTPWQKNADPRWVLKDPERWIVDWRTERQFVTLSIRKKEQPSTIWDVFLVIGRNNK